MADETANRAAQGDPSSQPISATPAASAADALRRAQDAVSNLQAEAGAGRSLTLPAFDGGVSAASGAPIDLLSDVHLRVKVELGRTRMFVEDVLRLNPGSVVELDKPAGDPVDIFVNDRHVARGEVLVVNDNFCVRVSEILQNTASA